MDIPLVAVFPPAGFNSIYIVRPAELKFMVYIWLGALRVVLCERYSIVHMTVLLILRCWSNASVVEPWVPHDHCSRACCSPSILLSSQSLSSFGCRAVAMAVSNEAVSVTNKSLTLHFHLPVPRSGRSRADPLPPGASKCCCVAATAAGCYVTAAVPTPR